LSSFVHRFGLNLPITLRVYASFFLYALALGGLYPHLAQIQRDMALGEGALGFGLIGTASGTLISLTFGGPWIERLGARRVLLVGLPLVAVCYATASFAPTPAFLFLSLLPAGICIGAVEQVVNLEADRVEHALGRRIMNRSHAFWSMGFATAGLLGGLAAQSGLTPQQHLCLMVAVVVVLSVLALGKFSAAAHRPVQAFETNLAQNLGHEVTDREEAVADPSAAPRGAWPTWPIFVLVLATLGPMLMEGAGIDWSAIYMRDVFGASPFICGIAVAAGATAQAVTRFFADQFVERYQPVRVARTLMGVLTLGVCMVTWAVSPWMALLGLALMGVGTSAIFPLAMSAAAQRTDRPAAVNVAALAQTSFVIFLLGPPLLGWVAEYFGIRATFAVSLPLIGISFWAAKSLKS
jgi:MFS family permease